MSRSMTMEEFNEVMKFINENNNPITRRDRKLPCIKYVDPTFDMRTFDCFTINLRGFGMADKNFNTTNEYSDLPDSLFDRVMSYLKGAPLGLTLYPLEKAHREAKGISAGVAIPYEVRQINGDLRGYVCCRQGSTELGSVVGVWRGGKISE